MKKKLFIRFFDNKDNQIPNDSFPLADDNPLHDNSNVMTEGNAESIADWMERHPNGKTDIVWL